MIIAKTFLFEARLPEGPGGGDGGGAEDKDAVIFFDDQRSLKVGFETGRDVDQVRLLVEARPEKQLAKAHNPRNKKPRAEK